MTDVKCRQIGAIPENITKDVFPDRMPNFSSCLIGQGKYVCQTGLQDPQPQRKGVERFCSAVVACIRPLLRDYRPGRCPFALLIGFLVRI